MRKRDLTCSLPCKTSVISFTISGVVYDKLTTETSSKRGSRVRNVMAVGGRRRRELHWRVEVRPRPMARVRVQLRAAWYHSFDTLRPDLSQGVRERDGKGMVRKKAGRR